MTGTWRRGGGSEGKSGPGEAAGGGEWLGVGDGWTLIVPERGPLEKNSEPVCDPRPVILLSECFVICLVGIRNAPETAEWSLDAISLGKAEACDHRRMSSSHCVSTQQASPRA